MDEVAPMPEEPPPQLACALAIAGGVLLLVQGLVLGTQSGDLFGQDAVYGNPLSEHLEAWSFLLGIIILGLATALYRSPDFNLGLGLGIVAVSLFSLFAGGGFVVGAILGAVGGGYAILFEPEGETLPAPPPLPRMDNGPVVPVRVPPRTIEVLGALWRPCPHCRKAVPTLDRYCRHCDAPLTGT